MVPVTTRGHCPRVVTGTKLGTKLLFLFCHIAGRSGKAKDKRRLIGMKMKRLLMMLLLGFSLFTITGCGNDEQPEEGEKIEDVEEEDQMGDDEVDDE
jgi:hypothetical protein